MGSASSASEVRAASADTMSSEVSDQNVAKQKSNPNIARMNENSDSKRTGEESKRVTGNEQVGGIEASKEVGQSTEVETKKNPEKPPPTREEVEALKKEVLGIIETHIDQMKDKEWTDEDGKYVPAVRKLLFGFSISYFALKAATLEDMIDSRRQIASACLKTAILTKICGVVIDTYPRGWMDEENKTDMAVWKPLNSALLFILNFSDACHEFAERIANTPGFLEMIRRILQESIGPHLKQEQEINQQKVTKWSLSISHNVSMVESNAPRLRSLNFTEVLEPYLQSPDEMYQLTCLATLAGIIDEKESEILNSNDSSVRFLLTVLEKGLDTPSRRYKGWSGKECALTVKMLARNDTNKKLLVELGALKLLVELAKGSLEEQIEAVGAIWALSFDEDNRKVMVGKEDLGVVSTLLNLKMVDSDKIKAAANGALWNLRGDLEKTEKFHELGEHLSNGRQKLRKKKSSVQGGLEVKGESEEEAGHIMISYQWANQKTLMEVRDKLTASGIKVWMDIDQMGGSTLQAMADAVENANIVLIAMSHKYKDSPNCRAEAEYAFQQRKKIVPLMLERGYKPDGWLGFILGAKLFYDFSGKYPFEAKFNDLLKELKRIKQTKGQSQSAHMEEIVPTKVDQNYHQPQVVDMTDSHHPVAMATTGVRKITGDVRKWTADDIRNWVNKNNLPVQKLGNLTAGEIALLIKMSREAPESFYKCIQETLKITDLLTISKLVWALDDIGT